MFYLEKTRMERSTGTENGLVLLNEIEQLTVDEDGVIRHMSIWRDCGNCCGRRLWKHIPGPYGKA